MAGQKDRTVGGIASFRVGFGEPDAPEAKARGVFRILVVGGFTASADFASRPSAPRGPVTISTATFDEVMTELDPSLTLEIPDPSRPQGKPLRVELSFPRLRSFRPDILMQEVEAFGALAETSVAARAPSGGGLLEDILAEMAGPSHTTSERPTQATSELRSALLRSILGHPEVRRLERTWRGLKLLVDRADERSVTIMVVNAAIDEVDDVIARSSRPKEGGGIDLVVVDYELGAQARDLERAERWASRAEAIPAPLLANASPEVLGFDDLDQLARTHRRLRSVEGPRPVAFRALTQKDCTRWLLVAMNGILLREAHTSATARLGDVPFEEGEALDGAAAWVVAVAAADAFVGCGWACALTEPEYRTVPDLNVHMVEDGGATISIATHSPVSSEVAGEAAAAGVTVLTFMRDRDVAVLPFAQMVYRGPADAAGLLAAAELTLADQLFLARIAPLVTELAAAIPRDSDVAAARDTARISLLSLLSAEAGQAPVVHAAIIREPAVLEVTIRPRGFCGVRIPEVTLRAPLGE